ncbi:hypothetical protein NQ317_013333 [Molorchus minor]|uniref:Reverse transcriptase domain-containing protein n=1 Tax=Molorchus minor TaxID=1323400 RepID=A0ABQ9JZC9_9CUCU|nr:hypothetical protein NQ317_013333 [Molorchus minor]
MYANKRWITEEIVGIMKQRDSTYEAAMITKNEEDWSAYREKRNKVSSMIRKQKQQYYEQKIDNSRHNPKVMWKTLKELYIAEHFNTYFIDSIADIIQNIPKYNMYVVPKTEVQNKFDNFQQIDMRYLRKLISSLPNKTGSDGIPTNIIKTSFEVIGNRFLDVINSSLQTGNFPNTWKSSLVSLVPKVVNSILAEQHQPINSLPIPEKILEITVKEQLVNYCNTSNIIIPVQSGFREAHSCESALQCILEEWVKEIDDNKIVLAVFLDFKRAFETVDRKLLLLKLEGLGIGGTKKNIHWIKLRLLTISK